MTSLRFFLSIIILSLLLPVISFAGGPVHGAKASAMGTAFVGLADDPSAILYNPAGLTQITGTNIYGGPTFVIPSTTYISPSGKSESTDFQIFFPPQLYVSSDLKTKDLRLGIGIYSPFGIGGRKWSTEGLTRYESTESMIATVSINPTVAYQVLPYLSLGLGLDYMIAKNESRNMVNQSSLGARDGEITLNGLGGGWGYNLGILFTPDKRLSLGFAYRSRIKVRYDGDIKFEHIARALRPLFGGSEFKADIKTTSTFPGILSFGIAYRPTERLTFSSDFERGGWSSFQSADVDLEKEVPKAGFTDSSTPLDWENAWTIKVGAEYKLNDRFALRGGYAYVETFVPDHTLGPANPDANQHNICTGFGYRIKDIVIDFFYTAGFYKNRTVRNDILSGTYENFFQYFGISLGKRF